MEATREKGKRRKPPIEKTIAHFLRKRRMRRATVPYGLPIGLATELAKEGVVVVPIQGPFWSEREFKTPEELKLIQLAVRITEIGLARGLEILQAADIRSGNRLVWAGKPLTSERLRAEIDTAILHAGGVSPNTIVVGGDQTCDPQHRRGPPL